nr:MAG: hypothetical protein DIU58_17655 [Sphaerobacter thermophilus]
MPIKGISEIRRLPRLGKIHLGIKLTNQRGTEYPKAVDYFVVKEDDSTPAAAVEAFRSVYGDKPRQLRIMFPSDDPEVICPQYYKQYGAGTGLVRMCDGERCLCRTESGEMVETECLCDPPGGDPNGCKHMMHLIFMLPDVPGIGVWQLDTSSFHSIVNINSGLEMIRALAGRVSMIPLTLRLRPKEVSPGGRKKTVWVLDLVQEQARLVDVIQAARRPFTEVLGLPEPVNHEEIPEDHFPHALPAPSNGQRRPAQPAPADDDESPPAFLADDEEPAPEPEPDPEQQRLIAEIRKGLEILGWPAGKINAQIEALLTQGADLHEAFQRVSAAVDARNAEASATQAAPAQRPQARATSRTSTPEQKPRTAAAAGKGQQRAPFF